MGLNDVEEKAARAFLKKYGIDWKDVTFRLTPTGIGLHIEIIYTYKRLFKTHTIKKDITDYDSW